MDQPDLPEVAYYYPEWFFQRPEWVKNLLVHFDGIAVLVPSYMRERRREMLDAYLAEPLERLGLLYVLEPESLLDANATERLHSAVVNIIESGDFKSLIKPRGLRRRRPTFHTISYSRLGGFGERQLADDIIERLKSLDLARETEDGFSIPMHPAVRQLILALLSQVLRPQGRKLGIDLAPATDEPKLIKALSELLSLKSAPSAGHVISLDLQTVGVDLRNVPLDEVLDFRNRYRKEYRAYARCVRKFVRDMSLLGPQERRAAERDRRAELQDLARDAAKAAEQAWKKPVSVALAAAGAAWTMISGDPIGGALGAGAALLTASEHHEFETGVFSYLFKLPGVRGKQSWFYKEAVDMAGDVALNGTIVEKDPASSLSAKANDGLYLLTEDHQLLALVTDHMATQASTEYLHERGRAGFESYLGKKVTVKGYLSGSTLWSATVID